MRVCSVPGCPTLYPGKARHCPEHTRQADRQRGTRQARGYNAEHDKLRAQWAPKVQAGTVDCWRCGNRIQPGSAWHLGHKDDRRHYGGPEHVLCNLSAAGKAAHN